ncbi:extracellular solute-binding protein [Rathayibacter sp. VKM Ac-2754]|uniref:extracellular solute-binding protein n=1 Tax=Rathayibacter sp. VKM Ac-2754 TaxID=2609251 RepID=UPI001358D48C|nr:extracellular solute-binding protein [Rathayibacter sp. VKM Ac-2754]MWV59187.1 extracellular solute-binding protein [Rathayibacter sp. VKM Ac-2754]
MTRTAPHRSRLLLTGGVLAVTALALAGCGRGSDSGAAASADLTVDDSAATGTVTLWAPDGDAKQLDTVLADYEAENPDLDLEVTLVPSDEYNTKLQTAVAAGTAPDIAFLYTEAQTQFLASDAFAPVPDDLVDSDSFFEGSWDAGEYDGTTYSVPWYAYTRVLIYRSDFAEAGGVTAPTTWDETLPFFQGLEAGGAESGYGADVGWDTYNGQTLATFAHQAGADLLSDDGSEWQLDSPEMIAAAEFNASFFSSGVSSPDTPQFLDAQPYLVSGQTGSMISGPWVVATLDDTAAEEGWTASHIATAVLPAGPDSGSGQLAGGSWGVTAASDNASSAWKVVREMAQEDTQVAQYAAAGSMPAVVDAWSDPSIADQPLLTAFFTQLQDVEPLPAVTTWTQASTVLGQEMEKVARGKETAADAMAAAQQQAASIGTE